MPSLPIVRQQTVGTEVATFLMNRESSPLALIDAQMRFTAVNRAFELLVGFPAGTVVGKNWADVLAQPADANTTRKRLREALARRSLQIELAVTTSVGRRVILTIELHGIGPRGRVGALVLVSSWSAGDRDRTPLEVSDLVYEIELSDFGRLHWVRSEDLTERPARQRCYTVLYAREAPCTDCPALEITNGVTDATAILHGPESPLLVDARRVDADHVRLNVRKISVAIFRKLVEARVDAIALRGRLTERETEVVRLILFGRSAREVSRALHISYSTAKFHQTNVLRKLGVESRLALFRQLL